MNKNEKALNTLRSLVGTDTYYKLCVLLAGEHIYFPATDSKSAKEQRNQSIKNDYFGHGVSVAVLVEKYQLSESQIRRILKLR